MSSEVGAGFPSNDQSTAFLERDQSERRPVPLVDEPVDLSFFDSHLSLFFWPNVSDQAEARMRRLPATLGSVLLSDSQFEIYTTSGMLD